MRVIVAAVCPISPIPSLSESENLMFEINNTETHDILELDEALGAMAMGVHCGDDDDED